MSTNVQPPSKTELEDTLGSALPLWAGVIHGAETTYAPLTKLWKSAKAEFGRMCLLQHKKRTLLYLTPDRGKVWIAIVLGERAYQLAMSSSLPDGIKKLLLEASPYAEGRGIRFPISSPNDLSMVAKLLEIKTTPS
jgi:Protein of unknown function (DUF3788)